MTTATERTETLFNGREIRKYRGDDLTEVQERDERGHIICRVVFTQGAGRCVEGYIKQNDRYFKAEIDPETYELRGFVPEHINRKKRTLTQRTNARLRRRLPVRVRAWRRANPVRMHQQQRQRAA